MTTTPLMTPPFSVEAEASVLGALLLDGSAYEDIADLLVEDDFYREDHRRIFNHISRLVNEQLQVDPVTVAESLDSWDQLQYVGGLAYLGALASAVPSTAHIRRYAELVREKSLLRQLAGVTNDISRSVYQTEGRSAQEVLDQAEARIFEIANSTNSGTNTGRDIQPIVLQVLKKLDDQYARHMSGEDTSVVGIPAGFAQLDKMTSGLNPGDLLIVAGRPSMGKTAFALNVATHVALHEKRPVIIFSMEMSEEKLGYRILSAVGKIEATRLKTGQLADADWEKLTSATVQLHEARLMIDDTAGLTGIDVRARARRFARRFGGEMGLIVIDYLQLMSSTVAMRDGNRNAELSEITRSLKNLAKELNCPVLVLSQLSREVDKRANKRPMLSDLRDSGAIEQDADVIIFMYRDEYYNADSDQKGMAEAIVGKNRDGPTGSVPLMFLPHYSRFESANKEYLAGFED